ncbi:MAG TPA: hypothetical protein VGA36_06930 [Nitriliruptorales bacterium]
MRSIADLIGSGEGRHFLEERGVFLDQHGFLDAMAPPARDDLHRAMGLGESVRTTYVGQQIQCDYAWSVTAKFRMLRDLAADATDVVPLSLPLDMDRAGSSKWSTTLTWPSDLEPLTARLIPHRLSEVEARFAPVDESRLHEVGETVGTWVSSWASAGRADEDLQARYGRFAAALADAGPRTLAEVNLDLTSWLLREGLDFEPRTMAVSELAVGGLLQDQLGRVVANIDDVVTVFNEAVDELVTADIDPQVRPRAPDYLPLRYSCPQDGKRRALVRERRGADDFAVANCSDCGTEYRFHLGSGDSSIDDVVATDRWSTDVTLPMYVNDLVSGVVAGQSTALYGLVLNQVIAKVLGGSPVPVLVPRDVGEAPDGAVDSLFFACMTAA